MYHWQVILQTARPLASLPYASLVACETQSLADYRHEGRFRQSETHCLLKITLAGEGRFHDAGGEHALSAGTAFLCEINDPDTAYYYPPDALADWTFLYVAFDGEPAHQVVREILDRHGPVFPVDPEGELVARLKGWASYDRTEITLSPADSARLVNDTLTDLLATCQGDHIKDPANRLARRCFQVVGENLHRNINVSDLAEQLDVSREHLTRVFREQTSQTPYQYIRRQKMLLAARLLKETDLSQKQIASRLGYGDPAQLSRTFKTVMHMTPSAFRRVGIVPVH